MLRKRFVLIAFSLLVAFGSSAAFTVATEAKPGCSKCRKDGCPSGFCYVDCAGCCYEDPNSQYLVCFR